MAEGISYFPLDVTVDDKIELIEAEFGLKGFAVIVKLYQKIYGGFGYYCEWTKDVGMLFSKKLGEGYTFVSEIVRAAIRRGIFDSDLYEKYSILTSKGVQKRYFSVVSRRKQINVKSEYLLIKVDQLSENVNILSENVCRNAKNVCNFEQSKVKESKEKKSKVKQRKESEPATAADRVLSEYERLIGIPTGNIVDLIDGYLAEGMTPELMIRLIEYSVERNARSWTYIEKTIIGNLKDGILTIDDYNRHRADSRKALDNQNNQNIKKPQKSKFNNYDDGNWNHAEMEALEERLLDRMLEEAET